MNSGLLNLDKPQGITSHDAVLAVRRVTGIRRVGHAGTLDPMATGVLVVCIGRATRLVEYLMATDKSYEGTVRLGVETTTYDAEGEITRQAEVAIKREQVETTLGRFRGAIEQVPPMYSAIKQEGQPLYKLARRGLTVPREARRVTISRIELTDWSPPDLELRLTCSSGTYVRSLVHDLGQRLNCGAHLTRLVRTRSGTLSLGDSVSLLELTPENWRDHLLPMEVALSEFPRLVFSTDQREQLTQGQSVARQPSHPKVELARADTKEDGFFALIKPSADGSEWRPHKVFD
jgi:tRNA pseudouridine55 synthase